MGCEVVFASAGDKTGTLNKGEKCQIGEKNVSKGLSYAQHFPRCQYAYGKNV